MSAATNDEGYRVPKLTQGQHRLLLRLLEDELSSARVFSVKLERHEVAAATGLEQRDPPLVRTDVYGGKGGLFARKRGGERRARLTQHGRAVARQLRPLAPAEPPLTFDECAAVLRGLANTMLDDGDTERARNLARAALEHLRRPRAR